MHNEELKSLEMENELVILIFQFQKTFISNPGLAKYVAGVIF